MKQVSKRNKQIAQQIKVELSWLIEQKLKDPAKGFITITSVRLSPDLKYANIYYSALGGQPEIETAGHVLGKAASFLRRELGEKIRLRYIPQLRFFYDDSLSYSEKILQLLADIKNDDNK